MGKQLNVYVSSFDDYADLLPHFFARFFKYWPDCPYQVYLGGVNKIHDDPRVKTLETPLAQDWSAAAIDCLQRLNGTYVMLLLDDFLLDRRVDGAAITRILGLMDRLHLNAVRLNPCPPPDMPVPAIPLIGFQGTGQPNRISTHATIWRRESLLELLQPGESIWEFEIYGSIRSNRFPGGICSCWVPVVHYVMGVNKGRWFRRALRSLADDGIYPDLTIRPVETRMQELCDRVVHIVTAIVRTFTPLRWRQRIQMKLNPDIYRY